MKRIFYILLAAASLYSCRESFEDRVAREAEIYTKKNCPTRLTEYITNDSMTFDKATRTVTYHYSIDAPNDSNILKDIDVKDVMKESIVNATTLKQYKEEGISFRYLYVSAKSKKVFSDVTITEKDYKQTEKK